MRDETRCRRIVLFLWNTGRMYDVAAQVRWAVPIKGLSRRAVVRELWLAGETVSQMLDREECRRQQPIRHPKLAAWLGVIRAILDEDKLLPKMEFSETPLTPLTIHLRRMIYQLVISRRQGGKD